MTNKIDRLIESMKANGWHGDLEEEDGIVHLWAERGDELVDIWLENDRLMMPAEYSVNGTTETERSTAAIRQRIEAPPFATPTVRREKLAFVPEEDDDATIIDNLMGRKVFCASTIAPDMPLVEHDVEVERAWQSKVVRFADGRINLDYMAPTGFRSLRVNNIVKVK